ncbi:MAG: hypothetical protein ABI183_03095 [Polyangiaceae bacterium]
MISLTLKLGCVSLVALTSLAAALSGCDEGTIPYFPPKTNDAGSLPTVDAAAPIRTVEVRNPFGDTNNPSNLMVDGDFELTGRSEQMPWITFTQSGQSTLNYATGGKCKSGVRCASIASGTELVGYFSSPKTGTMNASLWARPDSGSCADVQVVALDLDNQQGSPSAQLTPAAPDANGWCLFTGSVPNMAEQQPVLYVSVSDAMQGVALVDDGVVLPADSTNSFTRAAITFTAQKRERVRFIGAYVRAHRKF